MSIDTAFDPTRPEPSNGTAKHETSLKEEPVPHLDQPAEGAAQPTEPGARAHPDDALDVDALAERALALDERFRELVDKHPMRAIAAAVVAGFVIGRIVSRV